MNDGVIEILGLGAGVQSSTMALMAARGEITPMPDGAIFSDTQAEPPSVYEWLNWLEGQLPFPVYRVTAGSLTDTLTQIRTRDDGSGTYVRQSIPAWVSNGKGGSSPLMRGCTRDYKVRPIVKKVKELILKHGATHARQWLGISRDEAHRMKDSGEPRILHKWPLITLGMTRQNCLEWMERNGYPKPPRSACTFCPYHSNTEWLRLKTEEPEAFQQAVDAERAMQAAIATATRPTAESLPYLHPSLVPISDAVFEEKSNQMTLWGNECEGMCGV